MANPFSSLGPEFYNFLLPWLFTFAIVYGLLIKAKLFKPGTNDKISLALAIVIAFFVTATGGPYLAAIFTNLFGGSAMFLGGLLVLLLFLAILNKQEEAGKPVVVGFVALVGVVLYLVSTGGFAGIRLDSQTSTLLFWGIIVIAVVSYVIKDEKK